MLAKRIIPCLDVDRGRVVKGTKFLNLRDAGDPVECAKEYDRQRADELVFLDITASSENRATMIDVVERTASECFMPLTVGGGIRNVDDIRAMLKAGADKTSLNTAAVQNPDVVRAGADRFWLPVYRRRDRREASQRGTLGGIHAWRSQADRARCGEVGAARRGARRR